MGILDFIRTAVSSAAVGAIAGGIFVYLMLTPDPPGPSGNTVSVTQVSGDTIEHENLTTTGNSVTFTTTAAGAGVIHTEIPKTLIPEARYWMEKTNAVSLSSGYDLARQQQITLMYWRRWGFLSAGIGLQARIGDRVEPGVAIGGMWWF